MELELGRKFGSEFVDEDEFVRMVVDLIIKEFAANESEFLEFVRGRIIDVFGIDVGTNIDDYLESLEKLKKLLTDDEFYYVVGFIASFRRLYTKKISLMDFIGSHGLLNFVKFAYRSPSFFDRLF
ncbi:MAG: hypothetical protein JHC31_11785 [Sulfurihydrogenibium sp.]|jgi:hypothetical protein|nr:hypothetical protein [Sulfurihydrogenibium sp.]